MKYVFERARDKNTGKHTEMSLRRKGSVVTIEGIALSAPLIAVYEDGSGILRTSAVEVYNSDWENETFLNVQTRNSVYIFRKVSE